MGKTAEDMVEAGEIDADGLGVWKGAHGLLHASCPTCRLTKPLFALEHHETLGLSCDWCRVDADRKDAPPSDEERWRGIEDERRSRLTESLWATADDGTVTAAERDAWRAYRLAVAQIGPNSFTNPEDVVWPSRPSANGD